MAKIKDRISHAWNAFKNETSNDFNLGYSTTTRDYTATEYFTSKRSVASSIYNRIAIDVSQINIKHVRLDENGNYLTTINSSLNTCLNLEANKDQTSRAFIIDLVTSLFEEGCVAVVPVDLNASKGLDNNNAFDILSMRVGKITQWYPDHVEVELYNDRSGQKQRIKLPKKSIGIIENPFYGTMNTGTGFTRLTEKIRLLDKADSQSGTGKLDMVIQLPYAVKSDLKKKQAISRKKELEDQIINSKYGIAYIDSTEKVIQLNRPIENALQEEVEYLTEDLYNKLGITKAVLEGTANAEVMNNYYMRCLEPVLSAIANELERKFLTKTARTQGQAIRFYNNPFKLIPIDKLAMVCDALTRNEILTSNDLRAVIGITPSQSPAANDLRNKNINPQAYDDQYMDYESYPEDQTGSEMGFD